MGKPDKQTQRAVQGDPNQRQTRPRQDDPDLNPQQQEPGERQAGQSRDYDAGERNDPGEHAASPHNARRASGATPPATSAAECPTSGFNLSANQKPANH